MPFRILKRHVLQNKPQVKAISSGGNRSAFSISSVFEVLISGGRRRETGVQTDVFQEAGGGRQEGKPFSRLQRWGEARRGVPSSGCWLSAAPGSLSGARGLASARWAAGVAASVWRPLSQGRRGRGLHVDASGACRQPFSGVSFAVWVNCAIFAGNILYLYGLLSINQG